MPAIADRRPTLRATRSRGNSSRTIAKQSGKMPPPTPITARPATTTQRLAVAAASTEPAANAARATTSSLRLP